MNSYLLDTHILLWWLSNDRKLSKKTKELISNPENYILTSSVTIWEIVIKKALNKLIIPDNFKEFLDSSNIKLLSMTAAHAFYLEKLPMIHNDPFDRLLIAQAVVENFVFVTNDKIIARYNIKLFDM